MSTISRRVLGKAITASMSILPSISRANANSATEGVAEPIKIAADEVLISPTGNDDTDTINRALSMAGEGWRLRFAPGRFSYGGGREPNFGGRAFTISGAGAAFTQIDLGSNSYLIHAENPLHSCLLEGLTIRGGYGAFRSNYNGVNVTGKKVFRDNNFENYSECAIQSNAHDEPYWVVDGNVFKALNSTTTFGVALSRYCDKSTITRNAFLKNRIHVKLRSGGVSCAVYDNDFLFFDSGDQDFPRSSIWLVVHDSRVNAGTGFVATHNKFGNEGQAETDTRILFAAEQDPLGKPNGAIMPELSRSSVGYADGHTFSHNKISGGPSIPFVFSTTPNLRNLRIIANSFDGTAPSEIIKFLEMPSADPFNQQNLVGLNNFASHGLNAPGPNVSAALGIAGIIDPYAIFECDFRNYHSCPGGGDITGYLLVLDSASDGFRRLGGVSAPPIKDALGGTNAILVGGEGGNQVIVEKASPSIRAGEPAWIEFDLGPSNDTVAGFIISVLFFADGSECWRRVVRVPQDSWRRFRFPLTFRYVPERVKLVFSAYTKSVGGFGIGRVKVYHAREPVGSSSMRVQDLDFSQLPTSPEGLEKGSIWVDAANGSVLRLV
jgi:hypothetical protein